MNFLSSSYILPHHTSVPNPAPSQNPQKKTRRLTVGTASFSTCADDASVVTVLLAAKVFTGTTQPRRGAAKRADLIVRANMVMRILKDWRGRWRGLKFQADEVEEVRWKTWGRAAVSCESKNVVGRH